MYKNTQGGLSAILYTIAHCMGDSVRSKTPFIENSARWLEVIEEELTDKDRLIIRDGSSFTIELTGTNESHAVRVARLVRNSFQLHLNPKSKARLSTGVVLHSSDVTDKEKYLLIAQGLAENHSRDGGNSISFEDHSRSTS